MATIFPPRSPPPPEHPIENEVCDADSDSDSDSVVSNSSTIEWDQEPYETFQHKVVACAHKALWPTIDATNIVATRMTGGGYNRIVGICLLNNKGCQVKKHVVRVPRFDETADVTKDIAALQFVKQRTLIPVPSVVDFSASHDNEIGLPYMIQRYLKGQKALHVYANYNHQARCVLAVELGRAFRQILETQSPIPGVPVFPTMDGDNPPPLGTEIQIAPLPDGSPEKTLTFEECLKAKPVSVMEFIESMIAHRKKTDHADVQDPRFEYGLLDSLLDMAREMDAAGHFDNVPHTLVHMDLQIYNIMANETPFPGDSVLTAVIDWDGACLAPAFMACVPPQWLWSWDEELDELDERVANDVPEDVEDREIKRLFEEAAGPLYMRFAYGEVYRLGRVATRYCFTPLGHNCHVEEIEGAVEEWEGIRQGGDESV